MGYDIFCQAFERDVVQKGITQLSLATIEYDSVELKDVYIPEHTQSPTVQEVLGWDVDLRNEWERMDSHRIMKEQEVSLLQMTWRNLAMQAKGEEKRKESMRAQDEKRQRMDTGGHRCESK